MVTYDWRRCPYPTLQPPAVRPSDSGLPRGDYGTGPLEDQAPMTGYGPLSSDLGPRFVPSVDMSHIFSGPDGITGGGLLGSGCITLALLGAAVGWALKK